MAERRATTIDEFALGWAMTALAAVVVLLWCALTDFSLAGRGYGAVALGVAGLGFVAAFYRFIRRLPDDRVVTTAHAGALLVAWTAFAAPLSYLLASVDAPLRDDACAAFDRALGFDWVAWYDATRGAGAATLLAVLYNTSLPQIALLIAGLGVLGHEARVREAVTLMIWTSLAVVTVGAAAPAMGAFFAYGRELEACVWCGPLAGLRDGTIRRIALDQMVGIVQFPSFHTVLALIVPWACRGRPALFWPIAALNLGVLVSIPTEGGHFLADVAGGAAIFAAAAALRRRCFGAAAAR